MSSNVVAVKQTSITLTEETPFNALLKSCTTHYIYHTHSCANNNYWHTRQRLSNAHFSPVMLALCLMLFSTYYAQNYASIVGTGLVQIVICYQVEPFSNIIHKQIHPCPTSPASCVVNYSWLTVCPVEIARAI